MRIYLDTCCLQRPLDDQTHPRVRVETEAMFAVLAAVQAKEVTLLDSDALRFEIERIPDDTRRTEALAVLSLASENLELTDAEEAAALTFERHGIDAMDAIHLALASNAKADFFCTCDDKLLRNAQSIPNLNCKIINLLSLIPEITK